MNELTKAEAYAIANLIDTYLLTSIRADEETDNLWWLRNVLNGYAKLCKFGEYENVPNDGERKEE